MLLERYGGRTVRVVLLWADVAVKIGSLDSVKVIVEETDAVSLELVWRMVLMDQPDGSEKVKVRDDDVWLVPSRGVEEADGAVWLACFECRMWERLLPGTVVW